MPAQTTLKAIRRRMLTLPGSPELGSLYAISSLGTKTVTVSRLATGSLKAEKYINKWMVRADSTGQPADRERIVTGFNNDLGRFLHDGADYADTTATGETLELLNYTPELYDWAIEETLGHSRFMDQSYIPASQAGVRWLGQLSWLDKPSDIERIEYESTGILSKNRYFDKWNTYASGVLTPPDHWVLAGAAATVLLSTTQTWKERGYSAALLRSGTNATLTQTVGLLESGVAGSSGETLRGQAVTVVLRVWASVASQVRAFVNDGVTTTYTSYHTGGSTWEELTTQVTLAAAATALTFGVDIRVDGTAYLGECYLVKDAINDPQRRDGPWSPATVWNRYGNQGGADLPAMLPVQSIGGRYVVWSQRAYPRLDDTRVMAGTADADVVLAPIDLIATGAISAMFRAMKTAPGEDTTTYEKIANEWEAKYGVLQTRHLYAFGTQNQQDRKLTRLEGSPWGFAAAGTRTWGGGVAPGGRVGYGPRY